MTWTLGNLGKIEARLKIDSKEVFGGRSSLIGTATVVLVVLLLVVLVDDVVDVVAMVVVIVLFGRGENRLTGVGVVLLKSTVSIDSIRLGIKGRRVVEGFNVDGFNVDGL